jgi:archaetidylinositol phosphate synthase
MIDSSYRTTYQTLLIDPLLRLSIFRHVHPHLITILAALIGICILPLLIFDFSFFAFLALMFSGFLDTLDGSLARRRNISSPAGAVLDIVSDRLVEFLVILGLYFVSPEKRAFLCLMMLGSILLCITSFLVVGIFSKNMSEKSFFYSPGIIERAEAFVFFGTMILFPSIFSILALLFTFLVFVTAITRVWQFLRNYPSVKH